jgi:GNAT superfamily N-acetyltransferase
MKEIAAAGETFSWDRDIAEDDARGAWFPGDSVPPSHTVVAVDPDGTVLGTAVTGPNHGGPGSHIATASFMVDPVHSGRGVGRALGERVLELARAEGYRGIQFNAVAETNAVAVRLWQALGLEVLATIPDGFRHPVHGYVGLHIMFRPL